MTHLFHFGGSAGLAKYRYGNSWRDGTGRDGIFLGKILGGTGRLFFFSRRDGAVVFFSEAGRGGLFFYRSGTGRLYFFPRRDGAVVIFFEAGRDGVVVFFQRRDRAVVFFVRAGTGVFF